MEHRHVARSAWMLLQGASTSVHIVNVAGTDLLRSLDNLTKGSKG